MALERSNFILGIDGGASSTKAACMDDSGKVIARSSADSCNVVLRTNSEIHQILESIHHDCSKGSKNQLLGVALCLAGVIDEYQCKRVLKIAKRIWKKIPIWVTDDLISALYGGTGQGQGLVVISGTGASVYGTYAGREARAGGWGHVLGDAGSAYYIAHRGLRWAVSRYDEHLKIDILAKALMRKAQIRSMEELTRFVSLADKRSLAALSEGVFQAAKLGHQGAASVISGGAIALARNTSIVLKRLGNPKIPICVAGGVFTSQPLYFKAFRSALRAMQPDLEPKLPIYDGGTGAALWGWEQMGQSIKPFQSRTKKDLPKSSKKKSDVQLSEIEKRIQIEGLPTEASNPATVGLSESSIEVGVDLFLSQDKRFLFPALENAKSEIVTAVKICSQALKSGGRIFYVGAGTSGRLGILDASECTPTFRSDPEQVQGIIAGGYEALLFPVEGAEDDREEAVRILTTKGLNAKDVVVGIAASGRTPFVLSALQAGLRKKAKCILIQNRPGRAAEIKGLPIHIVSLETGPETLTGSTRLRSGTATKMVLNMISTLGMTALGKVYGNYMVDLKPTNDKLRARAIRTLQNIKGCSKSEAFEQLVSTDWNLRRALEKL